MKRDMDLIRAILLRIEEQGIPAIPETPRIRGYDEGVVTSHIALLIDAGFVSAIDASTLSSEEYIQIALTWLGHEFLDSVRDPEIWQKTKSGATKVGSWSVKLLGDIAAGFVRAKAAELGLPI